MSNAFLMLFPCKLLYSQPSLLFYMADRGLYAVKHSRRRTGRKYTICLMEMEQKLDG